MRTPGGMEFATPLAPTIADPFTPEDFTFQAECRFDPAIS